VKLSSLSLSLSLSLAALLPETKTKDFFICKIIIFYLYDVLNFYYERNKEREREKGEKRSEVIISNS